MPSLIWDREELVGLTQASEPEVRFWAVDRLVRHFPDQCCDDIAGLLLDDHELTPPTVARHLGGHGSAAHHAVLVRGFRLLRGLTPGFCLQALASLGYPKVVSLASDALKRGDLTEPALAIIVGALSRLETAEADDVVREYVARKVEILAEPAALRGVLRVVGVSEIPDTLTRLIVGLHRSGSHHAAEAFRAVMDALEIDDAAWCLRTGPSGHIELLKTIKAVESGYDCDLLTTMGEATIRQIGQRFRAGDPSEVIRAIAEWTAPATKNMHREPGSDRPERIASAVTALSAPAITNDLDRLGQQFQQWLLGFQLSVAFAVARAQNVTLSLKEARGDLERLLALAEVETAFHLEEIPHAIAVVCHGDDRAARRAQDWCLRMLEAQGPFFPRVVALATLGELRGIHFIPELMDYLSDENSYVYGAAERALSRMGEAIVAPAVVRIESGNFDPEAAHSLLVLLCDLGTRAAHEVVISHFDWFMDTIGPGPASEWVCLFGTDELIEPLRDWLEEDPPMVGQALLLLGAIHAVEIPEADEILRAIEDERARLAESTDDDGSYLM